MEEGSGVWIVLALHMVCLYDPMLYRVVVSTAVASAFAYVTLESRTYIEVSG